MSASEARSTWVVGYGSLMTAAGLGAQLATVTDLWRVAVRGERAFGKPVKRGGCLAMDVIGDVPALLAGRVLGPSEAPPAGWFGALLLEVPHTGWRKLVAREGYGWKSWEALVSASGAGDVAGHLAGLASGAGDPVAYRRALRAASGPPRSFKECHYLPHPVRVAGLPGVEHALCFVSPQPGATGDPEQPSIKARYPSLAPVRIAGAFPPSGYPDHDHARQQRYVELCLLAAAHGIEVADLIGAGLPACVAPPTGEALDEERARFHTLIGAERYAARFPRTRAEAWTLSGLEAVGLSPS